MSLQLFQCFVDQIETDSVFVIDSDYSKQNYIPLDLSKGNTDLRKVNVSSSDDLGNYINENIRVNKGQVAFGGYMETRDIYQRSSYFNQQANASDERNIHLGIDIWIDAGTNVLAVLDSEVHSYNNNLNHGDYGPTIILKHQFDQLTFYTLYGHLSIDSLTSLKLGMKFKQGDKIAELGDASVNGDYPPHLHFQVILDVEKYQGDYPGVSSLNTLDYYKINCPDPNLLLGIKS